MSDVDIPNISPDNARYKPLKKLGKGTYGQVYSALDRLTEETVAIKMIVMDLENEYLFLVFREIGILKALKHFAIVPVLDVVVIDASVVWIVTPLFDSDLRMFFKTFDRRKVPIQIASVIMFQLLSAVSYCHALHVVHRDIKPQNILIDHKSLKIKLADFGLSKSFSNRIMSLHDNLPMTREIVTLWYRAPEIILGAQLYSEAIDLWSLGVVLMEMCSGLSLFAGKSEVDTLIRIFKLVGTPTIDNCPDSGKWTNWSRLFPQWSSEDALSRIQHVDPALPTFIPEIVHGLIHINPNKRTSSECVLRHAWFDEICKEQFN
jgi:serine/threonine protein kinase